MTEPTPQWRLYMPMLCKAVQADDGRLWIEGIASDESVDLENEIVKASALQDSIRILCERGQIDWDHGRVIGGVEKAGLIPADEALLRFPEIRDWFGRDYTGRHVFWLRGWLDPPPEGEPANADLLDARHAVKSGHRLGFSLAGGRLKRGQSQGPDGRIYPSTEQAIITKVALTPCPINTSTVARLAKSLSAAMAEPEGDEPVWVIAKGMEGGGAGGLTAGTGTDHATFTGGRSLTPESLHHKLEDTLWGCSVCATGAKCGPDDDTPPRCRVCGGEMVRKDRPRRAIRKGLSPLQRIAHDLSTEEEDTMSLKEATVKLRKSVLRTIAGVLGKAAELDDEDLEDIEDDLEDVAEEVEEAGEPPVEMPGEDEEGDLPLGVEDEADEAPTEAVVDDVLAELEDAEDAVPDLYGDEEFEEDEEDDDEENEDAMPPVRKSLRDWMEEAEGGAETVEVLEAEGLLDGVLGAFEKSLGARLDAQDEAIAATMEATGQIVELLGVVAEALPDMRKSVEEAAEVEAAAERRQAAIGAIPAGTRVRKSVKDGDPVHTPVELENRITKALQGNLIGLAESGALRVNVRRGALEEVAAALDHAGA